MYTSDTKEGKAVNIIILATTTSTPFKGISVCTAQCMLQFTITITSMDRKLSRYYLNRRENVDALVFVEYPFNILYG